MSTARPDFDGSGATLAVPTDARFAIVAARFNQVIVDRLLAAALETFRAQSVASDRVRVVRVPGAVEIPVIARRFARSGKVDAVIALGVVVRGGTPHFDYVCSEVARGCTEVALATGVPVIFGVLTTDDEQQALERAGGPHGNKGADAALAALEMADLFDRLDVTDLARDGGAE